MAVTQEAPTPIIDPSNPNILQWPDIGLTLILNFITETDEATMISAFHAHTPLKDNEKVKKRISQHFGHHFDYTTFGASTTNFTPIPSYITAFLPRLPIQTYLPNQFTVQYYPPGAGIPPHVDTHSMFAEALYSLSFGGAVPMQFRLSGPNDARKMRLPKRSAQDQAENSPVISTSTSTSTLSPVPEHKGQKQDDDKQVEVENPTWEIVLPPRSLLLMMGPSRYGYTHAIRPRKTDVINGQVVQRQGRYSITMRTVRRGDEIGCDCAWPGVCDARIREEMAASEGQGVSHNK